MRCSNPSAPLVLGNGGKRAGVEGSTGLGIGSALSRRYPFVLRLQALILPSLILLILLLAKGQVPLVKVTLYSG